MDLKLVGKNVIVTGGTRGIGRAIVEAFVKEGSNVAFCARSKDGVQKTISDLANNKNKLIGQSVDVANHDEFKNWILESTKTLGGLDILILNAAGMASGNTQADWLKNFNVDLMGAVHATEISKPLLAQSAKQTGDAAIVYISSISAAEAYGETSYGPIKAALNHFAKGVAKQNASKGIRANVVSPGPVYFPGGVWQKAEKENPQFFQDMLVRSPTGRMATAEEIANTVVFLASPLSSYTTGSNFVVDGGFTGKVSF